MYSYCNRSKSNYGPNNDQIADYTFSNLKTEEGFNKRPLLCSGLNQGFTEGRAFPSRLIDVNTQLTGQDSHLQVQCFNDAAEIQFSTLRPAFTIPRSQPPTVQISSYENKNSCEYYGNQSRYIAGYPDINTCANAKMKF